MPRGREAYVRIDPQIGRCLDLLDGAAEVAQADLAHAVAAPTEKEPVRAALCKGLRNSHKILGRRGRYHPFQVSASTVLAVEGARPPSDGYRREAPAWIETLDRTMHVPLSLWPRVMNVAHGLAEPSLTGQKLYQ